MNPEVQSFSIRTLCELPADARLFLRHDYPPAGREARAQSSLDEQMQCNVHVDGGADADGIRYLRLPWNQLGGEA